MGGRESMGGGEEGKGSFKCGGYDKTECMEFVTAA